MPNLVTKYFKISERAVVPVTIGDDGYVNVGCTGCTDIQSFCDLAAAVIKASNEACNGFHTLPDNVPSFEDM